MNPAIISAVFAASLFIGMLVLLEVGRRVGVQRLAEDSAAKRGGVTAVDGSIFGLLGLLIAFTFYGAAGRFDSRRELVVEEANDIGTAYLRLDLLPDESQPALRELFRRYLDSRLETYRKLPDIAAAKVEMARTARIQNDIWTNTIAACRTTQLTSAVILLVPALNQMFDITTTRAMATQMHPPIIVFVMLGVVALMAALLAGLGMATAKARSWTHIVGFAVVVALTTYVTLDIEFPRLGLIRVDDFDLALTNLRSSMK